ncbi:MAG: SRPBCC family protein [Bacteroidetes bacterium]|nr:SRPBCC family protein [Bacteroidota bacterium]
MKILKIIGIIVAVLVVLVLVAGLIAPKKFDISRSIITNAPAETVFKNISHFAAFNQWNPWSKLDSTMVVTEEGTDGTVGAKHTWKGNKKVGAGSMTITKIEPNARVEWALDFLTPFEAHNQAYMTMESVGGGQKLTWGMKGTMPFPMNAMMLFMDMDKAGGKDYEEGLANLKAMCEAAPRYDITEVDWSAKNCLAIRKVVGFAEMSKFFGEHYGKMYEAILKAGAKPTIPLGVFYKYDEKAMNADVAAAIPFEGKNVLAKGYSNLNLPASKAYLINYFGDYQKMKPAYEAMNEKLKTLGRENPDMVVEEYVSDPMSEKDTAKWNTKIYFFVNNTAAAK